MAKRGRPPKPRIESYVRKSDGETSFVAKFTAYGVRREIKIGETGPGHDAPIITEEQAWPMLRRILDDVALNRWVPPEQKPAAAGPPQLLELFSDHVHRRLRGSEQTRYDIRNRIEKHLVPFFGAPMDPDRRRDDGGPLYGAPRTLLDLTESLCEDYVSFKLEEREMLRAIHARPIDPSAVPCPTCHAPAGRTCLKLHGRGDHRPAGQSAKERRHPHPDRVAAARESRGLTPHERWLVEFYGPSSRGLSDAEINKTLTTLRKIVDRAMRDYPGLISLNPVSTDVSLDVKHDRKKAWYRPDHVEIILRAAAEVEQRARDKIGRVAAHATFIFAGLRTGELAQVDWEDVDWKRRLLHVVSDVETSEGTRRAKRKTSAAGRPVEIVDALYPVLRDWWVACGRPSSGLVWPTARTGAQRDKDNIRERLWRPTIDHAMDLIEEHNAAVTDPADRVRPLDADLVPTSGRRTFATFLYMANAGPDHVMGQMGHEDAALALEVYAQVRRERLRDARVSRWMKHPDQASQDDRAA